MKYYNSIHNLPVNIYRDITKTGDLTKLIIAKKCDADPVELWDEIMNEFFEEFPISEKYRTYLSLMLQASELYNDAFSDPKKLYKRSLAEAKELEAEMYLDGQDATDIDEAAFFMSKYMGYRVNLRELTVYEFFTDLKNMSKHGQKNTT